MRRLDVEYARLLQMGFIVLRAAMDSGDRDWLEAEIEHLHNIPSLLGEDNINRHRYFWLQERPRYIEWVSNAENKEAASRMRTFYEPVWEDMESVMLEIMGGSDDPGHSSPVQG